MNAGVVTSYIIGGLLMLAVIALSNRTMLESTRTTYDMISKQNVETVSQIVADDFENIGYAAPDSAITQASEYGVTFRYDYNGDGTPDTIRWLFDQTVSDPRTANPKDHPLVRTVDGVQTTFHACITSFRLTYVMKDGTHTISPVDLSQIVGIEVQLVGQSPEKVGDDYAVSAWQKLFMPANLQF